VLARYDLDVGARLRRPAG